MRTLSAAQKKFLNIYDNLRYDAKHFVASPSEPENYAQQLYDDFMQDDGFTEAMRSIAADLNRQDILQTINNYTLPMGPMRPNFGVAGDLVKAVNQGNDDMLVDLIEDPKEPTYSFDELNKFWNIAANIHESDPELYTHLVADKRYLAIFEQTLTANEYTPESIAKVRTDVLKTHQDAAKTLATIPYDTFQMTYASMSDDIYTLVGNSDFDTIGEKMTKDAPQTIFSGLKVAPPLSAEKLTEVTVSYEEHYGKIQDDKIAVADKIDNIALPEMPQLPGEINFETTASISPDTDPKIITNDAAIVLPELPKLTGEFNFNTYAGKPDYTVKKGDNLWNIAKNEYGLKSYKDIMRAVDHIANDNGLEKGADANHIDIGQKLKMPSADKINTPVKQGDWVARDNDIASKMAKYAPDNNNRQLNPVMGL